MRTLKTCGPKDRLPSTAAYKPWAYTTLYGVLGGLINGGAYIRGGAYKFRNEPQQC